MSRQNHAQQNHAQQNQTQQNQTQWQQSSWQPVHPAEPEAVHEPDALPEESVREPVILEPVMLEPVMLEPVVSAQVSPEPVVPEPLDPGEAPWARRAAATPGSVVREHGVDSAFRSSPVAMPTTGGAPVRPHDNSAPQQREVQVVQAPPAQPSVMSASALDLTNALLVKQIEPPPASGWRRLVYSATGRRVNLGNSSRDDRLRELTQQVDRHLVGCYRISVLSLKGGVGKTTTTATLGSTFADIRGDRVIAVDANPDRGTLSQKVPLETPATVRNMLRDIDGLHRYSDVRGYTSQNEFRLEVLASDSDPAVSEAFSGQDYDRAITLLEKFYSIVLTDCGTGLMHSAMNSILDGSDALVVVSSSSVDGARSASATLDWLDAHGHRDLVRSSVAVVNAVRPRAGKVDLAKVVEHFEQRCRQVVLIPFDPHLEEGAEIDLNRLKRRTRAALLELAAAVASGFPSHRPDGRSGADRMTAARF